MACLFPKGGKNDIHVAKITLTAFKIYRVLWHQRRALIKLGTIIFWVKEIQICTNETARALSGVYNSKFKHLRANVFTKLGTINLKSSLGRESSNLFRCEGFDEVWANNRSSDYQKGYNIFFPFNQSDGIVIFCVHLHRYFLRWAM